MNSINPINSISLKTSVDIRVTSGGREIGRVTRIDQVGQVREVSDIREIGSKKRHFLPGKIRGVAVHMVAVDEMAYVAEIPADVPNQNGDVLTEKALRGAMEKISSQGMRPSTLFIHEKTAFDLASAMVKEREGAAADEVDRKILDTLNRIVTSEE
jgi:hypothetical protein